MRSWPYDMRKLGLVRITADTNVSRCSIFQIRASLGSQTIPLHSSPPIISLCTELWKQMWAEHSFTCSTGMTKWTWEIYLTIVGMWWWEAAAGIEYFGICVQLTKNAPLFIHIKCSKEHFKCNGDILYDWSKTM